jgi:cytochrome c peroxidase
MRTASHSTPVPVESAPANGHVPAWWKLGKLLVLLSTFAVAVGGPTAGRLREPGASQLLPAQSEPVAPIPPAVVMEPIKVQLGERLFRDARLSHDGRRSCLSCHDLERSGATGGTLPLGTDGRPLMFNEPTIFNASLNFRLSWRGNFRNFEEQVEAVLLDPRVMSTNWEELLGRLRADPDYRDAFATAYGGEPGRREVLDAFATFQRSLHTTNSPFDRWLRGERGALTAEEERGYGLFKSYGCIACHQGVNIGGNLFQRFGIFAKRSETSTADLGRFTITGEERDRYVFRVPSLRNVAATAPYFHDGGEPSLAGAVKTMARSQLGRSMTEEEVDLVVRFLRTLTGEYRGRPVTPATEWAP